jgi:sulfide:quinone oxidoreductase
VVRILILGAGFGGITVATELRRLLGEGHEILLVDRNEHFMMGLRKLWAVVGLGTLEEGRRSRRRLEGGGVRFLEAAIETIDPQRRKVVAGGESLDGDYLVVALGAEPRPDLVPGFTQHAHDLFDAAAIPALREAVDAFQGGRIVVAIAGVPYKCPPAPYEHVMLLDEHLRRRGLREATDLVVTTPQPILLPNAGVEGSRWLGEQLAARGIEHHAARKVERFEAGRVVWRDGELEAELVVGVPPHRPPAVVAESGLTGDGDWIAVDPGSLKTEHAGVFAIGDDTQITLANGLPLPKAGVMAEAQGRRVAAAIAAEIRGEPEPEPFDGRGFCFVETGSESASLVEGEFYATPEPLVALREPSPEHAEEKRRFERQRLESWFGS